MMRRVFAAASCAFVAGLAIQVFLAGAGLFKATDFGLHAALGWLLALVPLILLVLALIARVDRATVVLAGVLLVVTMIQPELAAARHEAPIVAAFHPVNALLVAFLAWTLARRATALARVRSAPTAAVSEAPVAD